MRIFNIEITRRSVRDEYMSSAKDNFVSRWARPPSLNTAQWLDMFSKSPRLAVVDRIASDIASVHGKLLKVEADGSETEITDHRFLDFMNQPNPLYEMTSSAIWRLHEIYLMLVGESFFLIERDDRGLPVELWNVPPHWVKMTPYLGSPTYTIVSPGGLTMQVPVDDMFVMKQLNPLDPFMRGLGIAESIADEIEIDEYAAKFQKRFFYNDATPPVVFLMPDATTNQRDEFLAQWNQKHRGVENSHRAAAFSGRVDVKELGSSNGRNLSFVESRIAIRDAVLEHFGVPREIMGITENSNRATADAAQYIYAKNVLAPRIKMREEAINKQLLPLFGDGLIWRYDPIIPYDKDFDKQKAIDGWNSGLLMQNEARKLLDMPDVEGGNVFKVSINDLFAGESDNLVSLSQSVLQEDIQVPQTFTSEEKKTARMNPDALIRQEAAAERADVRLFEAAATRHFDAQIKAVSEVLGLTSKAVGDDVFAALARFIDADGLFDPDAWDAVPEEEKRRLTESIANGLLDWDAEAKKLLQLFTPLWRKTYTDGAKVSETIYNISGIDRPEFTSYAKVNGGQRVVGIEQATKHKIAEIIARGVADGSSQATLRKYITDEMRFASIARVKTIARQETMTTLATGQFDMMRAAGATTKTWHHRPQKNPRDGSRGPNHVIMDGETVPIDGRFSNGLRYPRDPQDSRPEELINCRCYLTYGGF